MKNFWNIHRKAADMQLHWKKSPTQVFSSENCEIFKNTYFEKHLQAAASDFFWISSNNLLTGC